MTQTSHLVEPELTSAELSHPPTMIPVATHQTLPLPLRQKQLELWEGAGARLQMWKLTMENANDPILITTSELSSPGPYIVYVNRAFTHVTGYTAEEVVGLTPRILQGPLTSRSEMQRMRAELEAGRPFVGEAINYSKEGRVYHMEWSVYGLHDGDGSLAYYVAVQRDVSARKHYEQKVEEQTRLLAETNQQLAQVNARLESLCLTDSLTGIANRRALHQRMEEEISYSLRHKTPLSLLLLDVDRFKSYNDTFGHPAGDEALQQIAHLVDQHARGSDVVARLGGEEFAVLMPRADRSEALSLAEKLRQIIERASWPLRCVTVSIGVDTLNGCEDAAPPDRLGSDLLTRADQALYHSKNRGRNCVN